MFTLNCNDSVPLYKQLYQQIREHVLSGRLPADSRLPSVRELAAELVTSRNTVDGAYQELLAEGYLYSKERSGFFVSALIQEFAPFSLTRQPPRSGRLPEPAAGWRFDFHPARLDPESFPTALWGKCFLHCLRSSGGDLVRYGDPQGEWGLRRSLRSYLERSRGVLCEPEQIVICAGLQQSLGIVAQLLRESHAALAVENPGYHLPRSVFRNHGFAIVPVPVTEHGLDLECLRASAGTLAYVTPSHQLPMGYVMPISRRLELLEWAEKGGNLIIEDDYDSELRYQGRPIPSLQGLRPQGNIVYLGTFSKILSPALRLSYLVLPPSLLAEYHGRFADFFSTVSLLEQRTMAIFMEQGHWERHVRRMRIRYQKKHDVMLKAVAQYFGDQATVVGQGAGLHVVLQLTGPDPGETVILERALNSGIRIFPFSAFYVTSRSEATKLLLGFGGMTAGEIEQGTNLLSRLCI
jgi:GntR family transcriptional regulator/MocR family aminotransferase